MPEAERWIGGPDAADLGVSADLPALVQASRAALTQEAQPQEAVRQRELEQAQALAAEQQQRAEVQQQRAEAQRLRAEEQGQANRRLRQRAMGLGGEH